VRVVVTGGKTGGHVFPALAFVEALREVSSPSLLYVGMAGGIEEMVVPEVGIELRILPLTTPSGIAAWPGAAVRLALGVLIAMRWLRRFRPQVVFSTGGFVSVPAILAAAVLRIPVVVFLPDAHPGRAIRLTSRVAHSVLVSSPMARRWFAPRTKVHVTGYPVRAAFRAVRRAEVRSDMDLGGADKQVLVTGGSLGARSINSAVASGLPELLSAARIVHISGERDFERMSAVRNKLPDNLRDRYYLAALVGGHEMARLMFASDLAVTRAGASVLGELPAARLPAILIPLPASHVGQEANAQVLTEGGGAVVLPDAEVEGDLINLVLSLLRDDDRLRRMRLALEHAGLGDAAGSIAAHVLDLAESRSTVAPVT
jgi:UDP-N-acetylglucosamine--N-acetylmuramyl-(pentapeptide) pyrophosphoryl-undecaprenol N-acetylglucosamine transferase